MLVVQKNWGKGYEYTISAVKTAFSLSTSMVCIYKPLIGNRSIFYSGFHLYWPADRRNQNDIWVFTAIQKDIADKVIFKNQSDLADHPCCLIIDVKKLCSKTRRPIWRIWIVNMYNNIISQKIRDKNISQLYDELYRIFNEIMFYKAVYYY